MITSATMIFVWNNDNKQTNRQTNKKTNKQTNKLTNKQTNKQTNRQDDRAQTLKVSVDGEPVCLQAILQ